MDILEGRSELRRMSRGNLFKLVTGQRISKCFIGALSCCFSLQYKGIHYCVSELIGKGCLVERLKQWEQLCHETEGLNVSLPMFKKMSTELIPAAKKPAEFKVYYRDYRDNLPQSMVYLGTVIERRTKERENNLRDLLKRAIQEYSDCVEDPSKIFLLGN